MFVSPKCCLVLFFAMIPFHAWAKASPENEVTAYALMDGYKIPFTIKTEPDISRHIQNVRLTLDTDQIPAIHLEGPVNSRVNYKSDVSKVSLCGVNNTRVCLNISSHVSLDTFIPVSGQTTFSCFFDVANRIRETVRRQDRYNEYADRSLAERLCYNHGRRENGCNADQR